MLHHEQPAGKEQFRDLCLEIEKDGNPSVPVGRIGENDGEEALSFHKKNECSPNVHVENSRSRFASPVFPETFTSVPEHLHGQNGTGSTPPGFESDLSRTGEEVEEPAETLSPRMLNSACRTFPDVGLTSFTGPVPFPDRVKGDSSSEISPPLRGKSGLRAF
jgi:hypothetical protein